MKAAFFALTFSLVATAQASLERLAAQVVPRQWQELQRAVAPIGPRTLPQDTKDARRIAGDTKMLLDIFAFQYPKLGWTSLRDLLDQGYEVMGDYKDLYDTQGGESPEYNQDELREELEKVLGWKQTFDANRSAALGFLSRPTPSRPRDLPKYFWGRTRLSPDPSLDGLANIARLARAMVAAAQDDLRQVSRFQDLDDEEREETFHDFRKQVRFTLKMSQMFGLVAAGNRDAVALQAVVEETVDRYGDLHDLLMRYHRYRRQDRNRRAREQMEEVTRNWRALKAWQEGQRLDRVLDGWARLEGGR